MSIAPPISVFPEVDQPIVGELFSVDRLEQHAESLAAAQTVTATPETGEPLIETVAENGHLLLDYYRAIAKAMQRDEAITPAAQWLVDNFFVVEEQLREIHDHLPPGFYRKLPKLATGHLKGYPRVYGVAWAFVAHTDSRFEPEVLRRFVNAYQRIQPLSIGELWAVAITLRIVLVENLRRLASRIVLSRDARNEADELADRLLGTGGQAVSPAAVLRQFEKKPLDRAFAVQLIQRLRDLDPKVGPILVWLDDRLAAQGTSADEIVRVEHQQQASMSVTVRNIVTSMRLASSFDWQTFFEEISLVDQILRDGSEFDRMDFPTRDAYRHAIEDLARGSKLPETEVAERAVSYARQMGGDAGSGIAEDRRRDPGYYLISDGRLAFEREIGFQIGWRRWILRLYVRCAVPGYLGTIALLTAVILALPLLRSWEKGASHWQLLLLGLLAVVPASDLAIALINRSVTDLFGPRTLPRLEIKTIPENLRSIVVVPTLLTSENVINEQVEQLEIHYLANSDGDLRFALLSDWTDAKTETLPNDAALLAAASRGVAEINKRHGPAPGGGSRFFLFHRRRLWNESEGKWMGWERKRGKLHELNLFLRGATGTSFITATGAPPESISGVRYVITLDADTRLPLGAAARLIGTMAHPLNRPVFSSEEGRVVDGYGIVQPRITPSLPTDREGSLFQRIFSGPAGVDPYASAVSDVYQDLFHEGSFTGKGIYDLDMFESALAGKVPENILLSHDLFEGIFARSALATDIELFDEFPSHYEAAAARQYRWARGDWQLLTWIIRGRAGSPGSRKFKIPVIGRWKMLDNLRRSLLAPCLFLTLVIGWLVPALTPWLWTRFVLAMIAFPALIPFLAGLNARLEGVSKRSHFRGVFSDFALGLSQAGLMTAFLAYQAWLMADAIVRTLVRLFITHKHMLEWITAAQAKHRVNLKPIGIFGRMFGGVALGVATLAVIWWRSPHVLYLAIPFAAAWITSPALAYWISRPPSHAEQERLSPEDTQTLRSIARQTWRFFDKFVTAEEHFLPPDNFQEDPKPVVAHRTSPTNIGLYLLATLAARDFAWIGTAEAAERINATMDTIGKLEQFRGHLFNWYITTNLEPLAPKYVSTVDSGNLAGDLLALASACRELIAKPLIRGDVSAGVDDAVILLRGAMARNTALSRANAVTGKELSNAVDALAASLSPMPRDTARWGLKIFDVAERARTVADLAQTIAHDLGAETSVDISTWAEAAKACSESHLRDAKIFLPWLRLNKKDLTAIAATGASKGPQWPAIEKLFRPDGTLASTQATLQAVARDLAAYRSALPDQPAQNRDQLARIDALLEAVALSSIEANSLHKRLLEIAERAEDIFDAMDFSFLFEESRKLLAIGYRAADGHLDPNCYDMLASEARLASFIAIAKGDVPSSHWFRLSRALTPVGTGSALISWSGSMFEYLMPALVMRSPANSLLEQTYEQVVARQIEYGKERGVPWGISESAFDARDIDFTYQYSSFGVPGLGLKRGLSEDLVIAPYATALAALVDPLDTLRNFETLQTEGGHGSYGFYEALDYTSSRLAEGQKVAVVRAYMAHHQGMSLVALANALYDDVMCNRFHAVPIVQATELLMQERTPRNVLVARPRAEEVSAAARVRDLVPPAVRRFETPHEPAPRTALLSNGRYAVMLTSAGSGYSRCRDIAITRWRHDPTRDCWGSYIYLRDVQSGSVWSAGFQPAGVEPISYEAAFFEDHAQITRRDRSVVSSLEVIVSSEDDAEIRRVSITNSGLRARDIEVTSYAELALTPQATDEAHPAFANLFVQTEFVADAGVLLATRRKRSPEEPSIWAAHVLVVQGDSVGEMQYETDRARFVGRARDLRNPISVIDGRPLSNTVGSVLDPIFSLRRLVHIPAGKTVELIFSTIVAATREDVLNLADKYRDARTFERSLTLAWTQSQVELRHLGISADEAQLFQRLGNAVLYPDAALRPNAAVLAATPLEKAALWSQGISGDLPIVLARIDDADDFDMIRQLLRAHEYWRTKQLSADVVIINEKATSYIQDLQGSLEALVRGSQLRLSPDTHSVSGKIFLLRADLITPQTSAQLQAVARVVLLSRRGTLAEQIARTQSEESSSAALPKSTRASRPVVAPSPPLQPSLQYFNGLGGFSEDGREYAIALNGGLRTPEPWINVIANPDFGFLVSESGSGFTWSLNSHENQITPWSNDHVIDPPGEAIYLRDEASGEVWTPTALPIRLEDASYVTRHGQGYTRFLHASHGISSDLVQFVPLNDSIKISRLTLRNDSGSARRISVTAYVEWILGSSRSANAPYVVTELDAKSGSILSRSLWSGEFGGRVSFADLGGRQTSFTCDRSEFIGRNGSPEHPAALETETPLSRNAGAGLDPCAALQTVVELRPGASVELRFLLGQSENRDQAIQLLTRYRTADLNQVLGEVTRQWDDILGTVQVTTPDSSMDVMLNRWLLYQTLACRVWARAAFYQLSGAYGFRDQLQDLMALTVSRRAVTREHLVRSAARQFPEGDVQHWWHPPSGRGIRTRMSDDLLWLPYAVIGFIESTGDMSVLEESIPFIEGDSLAPGQGESYFEPRVSDQRATLFEHCARALDRSLTSGEHGLPLMGTGDWNDGMNRVGQQGKGESVWLGWFLHTILWEFAKIADARGERRRAQTWRLHVIELKAALERNGWDGEWYRRAYYDDGTPLGSASDSECKIDSIAQSWGVITAGAEPARGHRAMAAVNELLIRKSDGLILLLTPPFDKTDHDPGYIKGYVPGIRENGGQYSHAAVWTLIAFATLGDGDKAGELFRMLNPVNRSSSRAAIQRYKVEPYVVAGDIYAEVPHLGRGGWTWYTGSAGWLYRAGLEWILGFRMRGMFLSIDPCIPRNWPRYSVKFRYHSSVYNIQVENPSSVARGVALTEIDGKIYPGSANIPLTDDGGTHMIRVVMG
jgi:cyclic beta-1,2-glucan glucanotransferase